jgi:hypothetical protein
MCFGVVLVFKLRYEADIFLYVLSLFLHSSHIVCTFLLSDSSQHLMVLLYDSEQLFFTERFVQCTIQTGHAFVQVPFHLQV